MKYARPRGARLEFRVCGEIRLNFSEQFLFMIFGIGDEKFSKWCH